MTIFNIRNVIATLAALAKIAFIVASAGAQEIRTPDHLYASVRIVNGGNCGSGGIIGPGLPNGWAPMLSCGHVFVGKIGGQFFVDYPNGVRATAILRRISRSRDLSLSFVPTISVLEFANVPKRMPEKAKYHVCGYPKTEGPKFYGLVPDVHSTVVFSSGMQRWRFHTEDGQHFWHGDMIVDQHGAQIIGGNSGSLIYGNGQTVSVLSHCDNAIAGSSVCYGAPHSEIVAFLNECKDEQQWCGNWFAEPAEPAQTPAPPPPPPAPERGPFKPNPNIPIDPRDDNVGEESDGGDSVVPGKKGEGYDGHGRPPKGNRHPKERSANIDDLQNRMYEQEVWRNHVEELLKSGKLKGEKGDDGQDYTPPIVEKQPAKHDFTPLIIACLVAVGLGKFIGYKLGL